MNKEQRNRSSDVALLVNVVDIERPKPFDIDVPSELWKLVDLFLALAPIEPVLPSSNKPFDVCQRYTVIPVRALELVREAC